jgi:hypothetical protein
MARINQGARWTLGSFIGGPLGSGDLYPQPMVLEHHNVKTAYTGGVEVLQAPGGREY